MNNSINKIVVMYLNICSFSNSVDVFLAFIDSPIVKRTAIISTETLLVLSNKDQLRSLATY